MPREVLTGRRAETFAGFFGKLPSTGDFVSRGLPDVFRRNWDAWISRYLAPRQRAGWPWPDGGLRFRLSSGSRVAAGVILPGQDSAERSFPLSLILVGPDLMPGPEELDPWCDAAVLAAAGLDQPDPLWAALDALPAPLGSAAPALPALLLWRRGAAPVAADPASPDAALGQISGSLSSY